MLTNKELTSAVGGVRGRGAHTPGPWVAKRRPGSYTSPFTIQTKGGRHVANLMGNNLDPQHQTIGEAEANAKLIASAPDLVLVVRLIAECITDGSLTFRSDTASAHLLKVCNQALTLAGEEAL